MKYLVILLFAFSSSLIASQAQASCAVLTKDYVAFVKSIDCEKKEVVFDAWVLEIEAYELVYTFDSNSKRASFGTVETCEKLKNGIIKPGVMNDPTCLGKVKITTATSDTCSADVYRPERVVGFARPESSCN